MSNNVSDKNDDKTIKKEVFPNDISNFTNAQILPSDIQNLQPNQNPSLQNFQNSNSKSKIEVLPDIEKDRYRNDVYSSQNNPN